MMSEGQMRRAIVAEALTWELTPYHPNARLKGVGVDCAQLPVGVYSACGCMPEINPTYSQQWMLHRDEEIYLDEIRRYSREIPVGKVRAGDLMVWKFGRTYSHSAIVIKPPIVLHAVMKGGAVLRADYTHDVELLDRPVLAFSVFTEDGRLVYQGGNA
jgi:cell wall-associated NlpC family hydrolase